MLSTRTGRFPTMSSWPTGWRRWLLLGPSDFLQVCTRTGNPGQLSVDQTDQMIASNDDQRRALFRIAPVGYNLRSLRLHGLTALLQERHTLFRCEVRKEHNSSFNAYMDQFIALKGFAQQRVKVRAPFCCNNIDQPFAACSTCSWLDVHLQIAIPGQAL